ncbi:endonuclease/exonuclease/phosphatase family protein [Dongia sp.]|uniref:endonuclease/exonuclease/phosphatase family protein n=1 Tax=Dongia sp. TaxID=1977262 RepID=UPI0034A18EB3
MRRIRVSAPFVLGPWLILTLAALLAPLSLHLVVIDGLRAPLLLAAMPLFAFLMWRKRWWQGLAVALLCLALLPPWLASGRMPIAADMPQMKLVMLPSSSPAALAYAVEQRADIILIPDFSDGAGKTLDKSLGALSAIVPAPQSRPGMDAALPALIQDYRPWILKPMAGMGIFLRGGLVQADDLRLRDDQAAFHALVADARIAGTDLTFAMVHFTRPFPLAEWGEQARQVRDLTRQLAEIPRPMIVAGDFNALPWSGALDRLSAALWSGTMATPAAPWVGTFPAWSPLRLPIDQIRVSGGLQIVSLAAGPDVGSVHLPLVAIIALPPR